MRTREKKTRGIAAVALGLILGLAVISPRAAAFGGCPWDLDVDGNVGIADLLSLLGQWGTDPGGPPDFDGDGVVAIADLLELLANWGPCGGGVCGQPDAGSCFEANGTPGCENLDCCEVVCILDPDCCDIAWDVACKDLANERCGTCGFPTSGDCCSPNESVGCEQAACCRTICEADPFCCEIVWDQLCAEDAQINASCDCP